jgi:pimeloyl-ACP methyl ester carboxylesterase
MDALGIKSAVHLGHSMGVQVILEFYRRHPAYVKALVPMCGSYGHPLKTFHDSDLFHRVFPYVSSFIKKHPEELMGVLKKILPTNFSYFVATLNEINGKLVKQADFMPYFEHLTKLDWALFATMLGYAKDHTTRDMLGTIKVPTIIYGAEHDKFTPVWLSRDMHRLIPGSEFQFLPLGTHTAPIEHPDLIGLRLDKFLSDHFPDEYVPFSAKAPVKKAERKAAAPAGKKIRKAAPKAKRAAQAKKAPGKAAPAADEQPAPDTTGGNA